MAFATRTIRDTNIATGEGTQAGYVTVVLDFDADTATDNLAVDGSALSGFANGAKIHLNRAWWALLQGTAASNTGDVELEFKGASSESSDLSITEKGKYGLRPNQLMFGKDKQIKLTTDSNVKSYLLVTEFRRFD